LPNVAAELRLRYPPPKTGSIKKQAISISSGFYAQYLRCRKAGENIMNWVETLAEYYRLSRTGETQHWLCRRWLLQGEARLAYLRELLEPTAPRRR
jgi:hypothetical protein